MPNDYKVILNGFGLEHTRPKEYSLGNLREIPTANGRPYSPSSPEPDNAFGLPTFKDTSVLGTPVFNKLVIIPGIYYVNKFGKNIPFPYGGISLETVLLTVSMSKQIVSTPVQGRKGTIKEYITDGDYSVNIKGSLVDPSAGRYPIEQMVLLRSICAAGDSIKVASDYLALFSITNLVIQSYSFSQNEGYRNVQLFDLNCISDSPIDFELKDIL